MTTREELDQALKELENLEKRYIGCTPEQTRAAQLVKSHDLNYQLKKKELDAKINYLQVKLDSDSRRELISRMNYEDSYRDAMMDDILG
ncbi:MAG: hypothetical protein HDS39_06845 [Bacteroides sp.]|nr:hypothetical protein [Bacteroides sp.]